MNHVEPECILKVELMNVGGWQDAQKVEETKGTSINKCEFQFNNSAKDRKIGNGFRGTINSIEMNSIENTGTLTIDQAEANSM